MVAVFTADAVSNLTAVLLPVNTAMLIGIVFFAGKLVQKVDDVEKRVGRLEDRDRPTVVIPGIVTVNK